jgi:hypothetical protein
MSKVKQIPLPPYVKVGPFVISVVESDTPELNDQQHWGDFNAGLLRIRVERNVPSEVLRLDTLVHEINHAIYWVYNIKEGDDEERLVNTLSTAWTQVYVDNPEVLSYINQVIERYTGE